MLEPGRWWVSKRDKLRYGYDGMERDDEIKGKGNSYYTLYRMFDSRLGRWMSLDPKPTASESWYADMGNNPIIFTDILGDVVQYNGALALYGIQTSVEEKYRGLIASDGKSGITFFGENGEQLSDEALDLLVATDPKSNFAKLVEMQRDAAITEVKAVDLD